MNLQDLIVRTAEAGRALQRPDGSFPPGHNGPYDDPETPVRNTAHWAITLLQASELAGNPAFSDAARRAASYLLSSDARPMAAAFLCRTNPHKDFSNGLIGQAWVIEALVAAAHAFSDPTLLEAAREVFQLHSFSPRAAMWHRLNVDGSQAPIDRTFNHQLWFAAAGAMIDPSTEGEIGSSVRRFMDRIQDGLLGSHPSGLIRHAVGPVTTAGALRRVIGSLRNPVGRRRRTRDLADKEIGYHAFNLHGFALLHRCVPDHRLWRWPRFVRSVRFLSNPAFSSAIKLAFGGPYNPAGFEAAFAIQRFGDVSGLDRASAGRWIGKQLDSTYDPSTHLLERNTTDAVTLAARFYEVTRLDDLDIELDF